jgi:hypothetical protein
MPPAGLFCFACLKLGNLVAHLQSRLGFVSVESTCGGSNRDY